MSKPIALDLSECNGLGDLICSTPAIKATSESYGQKLLVVSKMPELFKKNPFVEKSLKASSVDWEYIRQNYILHNSFYNVGKKNERGVEYKHNMIDIRQFHAINLGFTLRPDQMDCFYEPTEELSIDLPEKYIVIHPVQSWGSRTWSAEKWMKLTSMLNDKNIHVVSVGKDSSETGFFNVEKPTFNFEIPLGLNLMNKTSISQTWHVLNKADCVVTMDSGILHLAGTTDTHIIQLGSSIHPLYRAPYRFESQHYKYQYIGGSCRLFCASDMKYGVKQWGNIQGVAPLVGCLENYDEYRCHPSVVTVFEKILNFYE